MGIRNGMQVLIERTGQRFGKLRVLGRDMERPRGKAQPTFWKCLCDCGKEVSVAGGNLVRHTRSCGCYRRISSVTHGLTRNHVRTTEYRSWAHMKERCQNRKCKAYADYGGRGTKVCS